VLSGRATLGKSIATSIKRRNEETMAQAEQRNVVPDGNGGWRVEKPGAERASAVAPTQAEAIDRAREILHNAGGGELKIHNREGEIRAHDTVPPGNDPRSSKG
jgi:hypothetical protein